MAGRHGTVPKSSSHQTAFQNFGLTNTNSASLAEAEREIKFLQDENRVLKEELQDIRLMCKQLITESGHENFDERRVNLLKSQIIQLERQMLIQSDALSSRGNTLLEVENAISTISDCCRNYLSQQDRVGSITVSRQELKIMVDTAESARIKLYKNIENTSNNDFQRPLLFMGRFVKDRPLNPVTLMDICSGNIEHINLKHVAKLESQLAQLYKLLRTLEQSLDSIAPETPYNPANSELPNTVYKRIGGQVCKATDSLKSVASALLELSLLIPASPWPVLQKPVFKEMTVDNVMASLPNFPKSKAAEGRHQIEALLKAMNYTCYMSKLESQCLKDEVRFHQDIYGLQMDYVDSLFAAIGEGYRQFEMNTYQLICQPLKDVLEAYDTLKITATEEALRHFLSVFKLNADNICAAVDKMSAAFTDKGKDEAIQSYGDEFKKSIWSLHSKCQHERDCTAEKLNAAKEKHREIAEYIQQQYKLPNTDRPLPPDVVSARSESSSKIQENSSAVLDKIKTSPLSSRSTVSDTSRLDTLDVCAGSAKLVPQTNKFLDKNIIDDRPQWDNSPLVESDLLRQEHTECTCGVQKHHDHEFELLAQVPSVDILSPSRHKPPQDKSKKWRKSDTITKSVKGIPQAKLVLKPKEVRKQNPPDQGISDINSDLNAVTHSGARDHVQRPGTISGLDRQDSCLSDKGTPELRANGSMRNSKARERRADSLSRIIQHSEKHSLDPIYPASTFSSAALKNSFGANNDAQPWK